MLFLSSCHQGTQGPTRLDSVYFSTNVQGWLKRVVPSVVGVSSVFTYEVESFQHQLVDGQFQPEPASPTGFMLAPDESGNLVFRSRFNEKVNGAGLIIFRDDRKAAILTNSHLVMREDTLNTYIRDRAGNPTEVLASRAIEKSVSRYVIGQVNQFIRAEIVLIDPRYDLAIIVVPSSPALGQAYLDDTVSPGSLEWGDFTYVFGNPREVKQLTSGLVSPLPQDDLFVVDAVARSGFSGGPVFVVYPDRGLRFAGLISGVPAEKLKYVVPSEYSVPGQTLDLDEDTELAVDEVDMIQYGTAYAIGIKPIVSFLAAKSRELEKYGVILTPNFFPN